MTVLVPTWCQVYELCSVAMIEPDVTLRLSHFGDGTSELMTFQLIACMWLLFFFQIYHRFALLLMDSDPEVMATTVASIASFAEASAGAKYRLAHVP